MKLSFDDEESFKGSVGSLRFNNPQSSPNTVREMESSDSMFPGDSERNRDQDIYFNNPTSDSNTLRGMGSSSMLSPDSPQERSEDT